MRDCNCCKDDRRKKGLAPNDKLVLPPEITSEGFFKPEVPLIVCAFCDGETLVASAMRLHREREGD